MKNEEFFTFYILNFTLNNQVHHLIFYKNYFLG